MVTAATMFVMSNIGGGGSLTIAPFGGGNIKTLTTQSCVVSIQLNNKIFNEFFCV